MLTNQFLEVETPRDHGLEYQDITLETIDGIKIKCYLMLQRKDIEMDSSLTPPPLERADEEVRMVLGANSGDGGGGKHADIIFLSVLVILDA